MRYLLILITALVLVADVASPTFPGSPFKTEDAGADVYVRGYTKSNGTFVASHRRSNPDGVKWNNYSY